LAKQYREIMARQSEPSGAIKAMMILFGPLAETLGTRKIEVALNAGTSVVELADRFGIVELPERGINVAIDGIITTDLDTEIKDGSEIAFLPPVSGG